jgi:hypothetical protein
MLSLFNTEGSIIDLSSLKKYDNTNKNGSPLMFASVYMDLALLTDQSFDLRDRTLKMILIVLLRIEKNG